MSNLKLSQIRCEYPWTVFSQCSILINKLLINQENNVSGRRKFFSFQPRLAIEQQSTVARSRSLTSKLIKAIISAVEKDGKVVMEELYESSVVMYFSVDNQ